ncbi:DUF3574 domain-containing protein [Streptomyces iconiensis]|uniref:DUF3574 domain-containing protein n=1 Tax=Streptomyces iconiensis TaxID=1384038 RepID=A0ABT7A6W7_9ACTN|nr:DUF3574 domain-containing protein [Streptomyces iconiensis]MDJ1137089.1 DUF3574 domain-containing protein [Streptomyces iconiensis]
MRVALAAAAVLAASVSAPVAYASLDEGPAPRAGASAATERGKAYVETRLFFGTDDPDGGPPVTDRQFRAFVDRHVTPRFPAGLTIQDGRGQWRDKRGVIERERSYELTVFYPSSEAASQDADIQRVRALYQRLYNQESVLRTDERTRADF